MGGNRPDISFSAQDENDDWHHIHDQDVSQRLLQQAARMSKDSSNWVELNSKIYSLSRSI